MLISACRKMLFSVFGKIALWLGTVIKAAFCEPNV